MATHYQHVMLGRLHLTDATTMFYY